jgi:hypothetical protein
LNPLDGIKDVADGIKDVKLLPSSPFAAAAKKSVHRSKSIIETGGVHNGVEFPLVIHRGTFLACAALRRIAAMQIWSCFRGIAGECITLFSGKLRLF